MPVASTAPSVLLPFVNELEEYIKQMIPLVEEWEIHKSGIYKTQEEIQNIKYQNVSALAQATNAGAEINNASSGVNATSPNKLSALVANLRKEMVALAGSGEGGSPLFSTGTVENIRERDALDMVFDGFICLVKDASADVNVESGFAVYIKRDKVWVRISDEYTANVKTEIKSLETRIHVLEGGLKIQEGIEEPEDKTVLWIT